MGLVELETENNWTLFKEDGAMPVINLPKRGQLISLEIMMKILDQTKIDDKAYLDLLSQVGN